MVHRIIKEITLSDKIINFFTIKQSEKVKGYYGHCKNPVFRLDNKWCKEGLCVFCYEMKYILQDNNV